jgi:NAD(P)-dependent dehydrogenase (short-subunit alcohol dehydrogenase family)
VSVPEGVCRVVDESADRLGGLDILVSCAGIEHFGALETLTPEDFDRIYHTNVCPRSSCRSSGGRTLRWYGSALRSNRADVSQVPPQS